MRKRGWQKFIVFALVAVLVLGLTAGCAGSGQGPTTQGEKKGSINIGYVNWAECIAVSNLWKVILEDQGYEVNLTQLDVAPLFTGLSKGDLDLFLDAWLPITHESYWTEYKGSLEDYGIWYQEQARIGITVPAYVTINSIEQLKGEAEKFNNQIIGIDPGAGIMKAAARANESYGLGFDVVQGSEMAMMAALEKAYAKKEWIAITGWSPHWMFAKYDLKYLDDPQGAFGEAEELHVLAHKDFSTKEPDVAAMLKKFKMSDAQIGSLEALITEGMEPIDAAKQWINDNQDAVNSWLN
ncbi:MAG TPA: glycine betaine ABC transporter substrate-binding protein [Peptococcaceae bacterium]|nr:glycine betaine ABC transporter substrate-binding protein [Peptococcaceae bacterium]